METALPVGLVALAVLALAGRVVYHARTRQTSKPRTSRTAVPALILIAVLGGALLVVNTMS